jgi:hypothetical protein
VLYTSVASAVYTLIYSGYNWLLAMAGQSSFARGRNNNKATKVAASSM